MGIFTRLYHFFKPARATPTAQQSEAYGKAPLRLVEYLYLDQNRLNAYFEQISNTVAYDKVPVWRAGMGVTGPTAQAEQARFGRSFSTHEKVEKLLEHIKHLASVDYGDGPRPNPAFRLDTIHAIKVVIPPKPGGASNHSLVLWLSATPGFDVQRGRRLILIQEYRNSDQEYVEHVSPKTALVELLSAAREQLVQTEAYEPLISTLQGPFLFYLSARFEKEFTGGEFGRCTAAVRTEFRNNGFELTESASWSSLTDLRSAPAPWEVEISDREQRYLLQSQEEKRSGIDLAGNISVFKNVRQELAARFATRPGEILQQLGAAVSESRLITTLYRVRSWMLEGVMPNDVEYTFGYPIFIVEGREFTS